MKSSQFHECKIILLNPPTHPGVRYHLIAIAMDFRSNVQNKTRKNTSISLGSAEDTVQFRRPSDSLETDFFLLRTTLLTLIIFLDKSEQ